jgi:hypothetical protein
MVLWSARARCATLTSRPLLFVRLLWHNPGADTADQRQSRDVPAGEATTADGDPFAAFVVAYDGPLFAYLWRMTGDEAAAHDLRQETFIRA